MAKLRILIWAGLVLAVLAPGMMADTLVTKSGSVYEGTVREEGDKYILKTANGGEMTFDKSMVGMVTKGPAASGPSGAGGGATSAGSWTESVGGSTGGSTGSGDFTTPTTAPVTPQTLRYDGIYQTQELMRPDNGVEVKYHIYYRFFRSGEVIVSSHNFRDASDAIHNLVMQKAEVKGTWTIKDGKLTFKTTSPAGEVWYEGYAGFGGLQVDVDSKINKQKLAFNLTFVADNTATSASGPAKGPHGPPPGR